MNMETLLKRFAAICEKYYAAAEETGGVQQGNFVMIGEMFADYSATIGSLELRVYLPQRGACIQFRNNEVTLPTNTTDTEFAMSCSVLEANLEQVAEKWQAEMPKRAAANIARLQEGIKKAQAEIKKLQGA